MAEPIAQLPTGSSPILTLPNELIDQIPCELSNKDLVGFRVMSKCFYDITLEAWEKRALQDRDGYPTLEWATAYDKSSLIDYILGLSPKKEINIPQGGRGTSPLSIACALGKIQAALPLIRHGADVNYIPVLRLALLEAVHEGHYMVVWMLLDGNANPML